MNDTTFYRGENPLKADKLNTAFSERISRSGDTMQGTLLLYEDPIQPMEAATRRYVDNRAATVALTGDTPPTAPSNGQIWWNSVDGNTYIWYDDGTSAQWVPAMFAGGQSTRPNIANLPPAQADGSPPVGAVHGDLYNNGGFVCVTP